VKGHQRGPAEGAGDPGQRASTRLDEHKTAGQRSGGDAQGEDRGLHAGRDVGAQARDPDPAHGRRPDYRRQELRPQGAVAARPPVPVRLVMSVPVALAVPVLVAVPVPGPVTPFPSHDSRHLRLTADSSAARRAGPSADPVAATRPLPARTSQVNGIARGDTEAQHDRDPGQHRSARPTAEQHRDRDASGYRCYQAADVGKVRQIRGLLDSGLPTEIVLPADSC
jgi:hypothetical protein